MKLYGIGWRVALAGVATLLLVLLSSVAPPPAAAGHIALSGAGTVAVDMDPIGTPVGGGATAGIDPGDIQSSVTLPIGGSVTFDIVVDSVPAPGLFGVGGEILYDPNLLKVTGVDLTSSALLQFSQGGIPLIGSSPLPDTDGSFRVDSANLAVTLATGPGRVLTVTVECFAAGVSLIELTDTSTGGGVNFGILGPVDNYSVPIEIEGTVTCETNPIPNVAGPWAAVYSTNLQTLLGDCQGGITQTGSSLTSGAVPWSCESGGVPVPGLTNVDLTGTLSGASVTGDLAGSVNFSGTFSSNGRSGEGTWTGPGSGLYKMAKQRPAVQRFVIGENSFLRFPLASGPGVTAIISSTTGSSLPQFLLDGQIYHVITTVPPIVPPPPPLTDPYFFCISYPGTIRTDDIVFNMDENLLQVGHLEGGLWSNSRSPASDPVQNIVCTEVTSLSEFAIVAPGPIGGLVTILSADHSSGARVWPYVAAAALSIFSLGLISFWAQRRWRLN